MSRLLESRLSRRATLRGGLGLAATTILAGAGLAGCSDDNNDSDDGDHNAGTGTTPPASSQTLSFDSVPRSLADQVVVPDGYSVDTLLAWGTPIVAGAAAFDPATNTAADQAGQTGMHHDGMYLFQADDSPNQGILVVNHENITRENLLPAGRSVDGDGMPNDPEQIRREMAAHGMSVVQIARDGNGRWAHQMSSFNRRITAMTDIAMSGPVAGSEYLVTPYSPDGTATRGTLNNCGRGFTPWGTYLSGEENIQGYFTTTDTSPALSRYGIDDVGFGFFWAAVSDDATDEDNGEFARFDVTANGSGATDDWRNEVNNFGWVVEVDPGDPSSTPRKRTAMGRFRHEGVEPSLITEGKQIAFYMGDDARGEYCYKFVTEDAWNAASPAPDMLDRGTLYVARFDDDGTGKWLPLDVSKSATLAGRFASQAELLVNTRIAADLAGATPMDRPEWSAVDPISGDVYYTLTNNSDRGSDGEEAVNAANPRANNTYGHIIRQTEAGNDPAATTFTWDIFVFGAPASADDNINRSGLTTDNEFAGPDGLWFDRRGVLWIQTDNGGNEVADATNDQMLAVIPAALSGDRTITPDNQASLKRFLVGPQGCEMTGSELSADAKTLFANVQHPGGRFPDYTDGVPPRSATLAISRDDGGEIAL
ncbi:PhoX family protein [Salinisphaera aquimarina]|uniref:PhoX family protein n=1 Tax=Salinisphaera aquimarina TaxID=2094031 RepID=A0ABV7EJ99_9GAMM